ncbi:carbohydrate kinase [Nocardioides caeni]|uniref:Carbohydrate kinase n=1 Tax=Nocardioides caeni TaxID=574700 RepID=A0A4S8ND87_9ACTN|nr:carbohydrate kinase [Nocardioides caeni]
MAASLFDGADRAGHSGGVSGALVIGEAVLDVLVAPDDDGDGGPAEQRPGGSAVNAAVALARLGRPVQLATALGPDRAGGLIRAHLAAAGVVLIGDPDVLDSTGRAEAVVDATGAASYSFDIGWSLPADVDAVDVPRVVHVTSLGPLVDPGGASTFDLVEALRPHTAVSYDINLRPGITGMGADVRARVEAMAALSDVVKASDEDLVALWPDRLPGESATHLLGLGPAAVVVTHGGEGASWHACHGADWSTGGVHALPADVVHPIGAGDTFAAALIDHLWPLLAAGPDATRDALGDLDPPGWTAALTWAARAAAVTVARPGADPPTRDELG